MIKSMDNDVFTYPTYLPTYLPTSGYGPPDNSWIERERVDMREEDIGLNLAVYTA